MRCIALAVAAATAFSSTIVNAQSTSSGPVVGIWAGMTSSTFRGSDAPGPTNLAGFSAGLFTQWRLSQHFALQPELEYTQKGSDEVDVTESGTPFTMHIRLSYIEVPVLLRAEGRPMGAFTPFAVIGPEVAFKAGCGIVVNGLQGSYTCANLPAQESVDYGGIVGAGVAARIAGRMYGLSVRYDAGMADTFSQNNAKNRALTVLLGTVF